MIYVTITSLFKAWKTIEKLNCLKGNISKPKFLKWKFKVMVPNVMIAVRRTAPGLLTWKNIGFSGSYHTCEPDTWCGSNFKGEFAECLPVVAISTT